MTMDSTSGAGRSDASERVGRRTIASRRRRVVRSAAALFVAVLAMAALSIVVREQEDIKGCRDRMEYAAADLQRVHDERGRIPYELPLPEENTRRHHFLYNSLYPNQVSRSRPEVGVCCCFHPHSGLFMPNGRHIVVYHAERETYTVEWLSEADFAERAEQLGLRVMPGP